MHLYSRCDEMLQLQMSCTWINFRYDYWWSPHFPSITEEQSIFLQPAILIKLLVDLEIMQFATSTDEPRVVHVVLEKANPVPCVGLISQPQWPNGHLGLDLAPWSGAPSPSMAGGPPSHCALNRGGVDGSLYEVRLSRTPHLETLLRSNRGAQPVTGSTAAATALRHHGLHCVALSSPTVAA